MKERYNYNKYISHQYLMTVGCSTTSTCSLTPNTKETYFEISSGTARFVSFIWNCTFGVLVKEIIFVMISECLYFFDIVISEHGYGRRSTQAGTFTRMSQNLIRSFSWKNMYQSSEKKMTRFDKNNWVAGKKLLLFGMKLFFSIIFRLVIKSG